METKDKRVKREIANSNERRRMQSINAGFQKLKRLLPISDGEKLSKAAILQNASDFIQQIEREKHMLYEQNTLLRGILLEVKGGTDICTALETTDLDAPIIPLNTHIANTTNNTTDNNSNVTTKEVHKQHQQHPHQPHQHQHQQPQPQQQQQQHQQQPQQQQGNKQVEESSKSNNKNNNNTTSNFLVSSGVAKAAIALPLEVPYTSETARELHPEVSSRKPHEPQDPAPKGQNLDTICKAIMEIEGDRVFNSENIKQETQ